jgi:hypothetical protein
MQHAAVARQKQCNDACRMDLRVCGAGGLVASAKRLELLGEVRRFEFDQEALPRMYLGDIVRDVHRAQDSSTTCARLI